MGRIISILVAVAVIGGAAYYFLAAGGGSMSDEEIAAYLAGEAETINSSDGLRYDDWSQLMSAVAVEKQITIRGDSLLNMADLNDDYLSSREAQAVAKLCGDDASAKAVNAGATFVYNWFSADDESIGMVRVSGADTCG